RRCLELARLAEGRTSPNPMVGCVIVRQGRIIGEGYHHQAGEPHAEVNAIRSVADPQELRQATLYVNLEPCSHWGKTPPCADMIIRSGIPEVVVGMVDPFAEVSGNGIRKLRQAGITVHTEVLEHECRELNRRFITYHTFRRPYITLKWAQTLDGYLDNNRPVSVPATWMTGPVAKILVHRLRAQSDAILTGTHTIRRDNPALTVRESGGKSPVRVVLDRSGNLSPEFRVFDGASPTLILTQKNPESLRPRLSPAGETVEIDFARGWNGILEELYRRRMQSILVEGGRVTLQSLIDAGLWDEAYIFSSRLRVHELTGGSPQQPWGVKAPELPGKHPLREEYLDGTRLYYTQNLPDSDEQK
ncbi:MAG: bifunctional diaminohydroxyphosphoribosylaminopyrimidine deaminase/5-amino-6-(5-phosphoribosylamino)uracil reductase RibD, partial [Rikenellaceae bacterium]|nr:bifunctional diaminohydroxyphosphoribosylaminopyrimidine deaminase/5-amino-6-(5-phosphoribosylamino)uracil reductase RibD [Rikenellaceae bacterium]